MTNPEEVADVSDEIKERVQLASERLDELLKTEEAYKVLRTGHAAMSERLDKAWHAVCGSGMDAPDALARLLEIIDGQHGDADPHMAAIDVLRAKKIEDGQCPENSVG